MASFDSADLLLSFDEKAGRPTTDAVTDGRKYARLAKSQNRIVALIAGICPTALYPTSAYTSLPTMSTTDNKVFTFGTPSVPITPIGKTGIYRSLNDIPNYPMRQGVDYLPEGGTSIRIPNNATESATLYWLGITPPADLSAGQEPVLFPVASRELIVIDAVRQFAVEGGRNPDLAALMAAEWAVAWPTWCTTWKTSYRQGGTLGTWTGMQLATAGQWATP